MAKKKKIVKTTVKTTVETTTVGDEKTHIICILDRSGSMSNIMKDSIGGFNTFLQQQRELPDDATITVALFDDKYELLYDNINIKEVKDITPQQWFARGTTALYDAVGKTINTDKANIANMKKSDKPNKVLVCVVTDGWENASEEYTQDQIKSLIKDCEKNDWNFVYLAANQDAFAVGQSFGISRGNTLNYTATMDGVSDMSNKLNSVTASYRGMSSNDVAFASVSKSLVEDDDDEKEDLSGTINFTSNTTGDATVDLDNK